MKKLILNFLLIISPFSFVFGNESELKAYYNSLDPTSISQMLAFYELYPQTKEGCTALQKAWTLLNLSSQNQKNSFNNKFPLEISQLSEHLTQAILGFTNRTKLVNYKLHSRDLNVIENLGNGLANRKLKGFRIQKEQEVLKLEPEEIDLGRALLLSQLGSDEKAMEQICIYEAMLDVMSLQIIAKLPQKASNEEKINAINQFIFDDMHFRFPPQSEYAKDIDVYTFLPSVLDQHLGVCLGVTTIYLCLSQRLNLPLEVITPPGHIYVRYKDPQNPQKKEINIETTARGVDMPSETYLGVNTWRLEVRTLKEVIGMTHVNQASIYLHNKDYVQAVRSYEKAKPYMPDDPMLNELLGYSYLLSGSIEKGEEFLKKVIYKLPYSAFVRENIIEDYLNSKVDVSGIEAVLMSVDNERGSILKKLDALKNCLKRCPEFRAGWHQLAVAWLQLKRSKEAIDALIHFHHLDQQDPTIEYYLAVLHAQRLNFSQAWIHLKNAEKITQSRNFLPKTLKELHQELSKNCPL